MVLDKAEQGPVLCVRYLMLQIAATCASDAVLGQGMKEIILTKLLDPRWIKRTAGEENSDKWVCHPEAQQMVLTVKAISLLAPFGRKPSNAVWAVGSGAVRGRWCLVLAELQKAPMQWGQCCFAWGYSSGSSSWASQSPGSCSCVTGFISHLPPAFSLPLISLGVSALYGAVLHPVLRVTYKYMRKMSLKYILLRIPAEMLWIFPAEEELVRAAVFPGVSQRGGCCWEGRIQAASCLWGKFVTLLSLSHQAWLQQVSLCSCCAFV